MIFAVGYLDILYQIKEVIFGSNCLKYFLFLMKRSRIVFNMLSIPIKIIIWVFLFHLAYVVDSVD